MLTEKQLEIADEWIQENVDMNEFAFDGEIVEKGNTVKYFFCKCDESIVYHITIEKERVVNISKEIK